eukprot:6199612-Pleurochrysis_carterae.AAC.1
MCVPVASESTCESDMRVCKACTRFRGRCHALPLEPVCKHGLRSHAHELACAPPHACACVRTRAI